MGRPVSDRKTKAVTLRIEASVEARLRALAESERRPISNMAEIIFEFGLDAYQARAVNAPTHKPAKGHKIRKISPDGTPIVRDDEGESR